MDARPLDGIVVLDLTRLLPGAAATMLLADFGAEVIKIEEPERGDYARSMPPFLDGEGAIFAFTNRGKKSVALDLKDPRGREALLRLAEKADVLMEGFRPGAMARLGLDYEALRSRNERLIYVALTGYGQSGPYAARAGHDVNYLSLGGVLGITGAKNGPPAIPGTQLADLAGGAMQAVIGILLALAARGRTGCGQMVDVSMLDGVVSMLPVPMALYAATGRIPERGAELLSGRYACYNVYQAGDGRWISVGALEPKFWAAFCRATGCEQFIADQFSDEKQRDILAAVSGVIRTRSASHWSDLLADSEACVTVVQDTAEVARDPHLREREMILPDGRIGVAPKLSGTPGRAGGTPPQLGRHTREVLSQAGLSEREIAGIIQR